MAQHQQHEDQDQPAEQHEMWMRPLASGWQLMGMAQVFPVVTRSMPFDEEHLLYRNELYFTQASAMFNITDPGSRFVLRSTLNFEGLTLPDGELTFGGWGEGFIDSRHPHTLLHELMLTYNFRDFAGGDFSLSAGKGFATYGTDDPMVRPVLKFPTNHHLSQILERWVVMGAFLVNGWGFEASLFGGEEPEGPYDFSNIESFGNSWSARISRRFGDGDGPLAQWETSASFGRVKEAGEISNLYNASVRYASDNLYSLAEASFSEPEDADGYFSLLGEVQLGERRHQPYYRIEYSTRPEYPRDGTPGTDDFFRYDHHDPAEGATRWLINSVGYSYELSGFPFSALPFIELQHNQVWHERGSAPDVLFDDGSFWSASVGFRLFFGGRMARMGSYGILDPMTGTHQPAVRVRPENDHHH